MAVRYVSEFSFPSEYGFHKSSSDKGPKGMSGYAKSKAGPSVVTGSSRGSGGGKLQSGMVSKFAKGGLAKGAPVGKGGSEKGGIGTGSRGEHFGKLSDRRSPAATRTEKSSGVQKPAFKKGGSTTPQRYKAGDSVSDSMHGTGCNCRYCGGGMAKKADGGSIKVAKGAVPMGKKSSWNKDDAVSPGSFKRTPPKQGVKNKDAANSKFDADERNEEPATKQSGNVERMSGWSDFKKGGKVHKKAMGGQVKTEDRYETGNADKRTASPDKQSKGDGMAYKSGGRIKNLGKYAHGGKVYKDGSTQKIGGDDKYESRAGTPKKDHMGSQGETASGNAYAMGGLSRGTSKRKNAAIHAKQAKVGALAHIVDTMAEGPHQGGGMAPPGTQPQMGSPPGMPMGPRAAPPMAGGAPGAPMMAHGGSVRHVVVHHVSHGGRK